MGVGRPSQVGRALWIPHSAAPNSPRPTWKVGLRWPNHVARPLFSIFVLIHFRAAVGSVQWIGGPANRQHGGVALVPTFVLATHGAATAAWLCWVKPLSSLPDRTMR